MLIIDAHVERVRRDGQVRSTAALWVVGVGADGSREHLGVWLGASESAASWRTVFADVVTRGLTGVQAVVRDEHAGLVQAVHRFFPTVAHQRCQVHVQRNARDKVSSPALKERLRDEAPRAAAWLEQDAPDTLAVYTRPTRDARRRLATTNSIEHDHMAVRRRTSVVRVFPNEASGLRLDTALAVARNEQWRGRRYVPADPPPPRRRRSCQPPDHVGPQERSTQDSALDPLAARFHHQLVLIHPWPNGNGRHARLATDLLLQRWGRPPFTWGAGAPASDAAAARAEYLRALREADAGRFEALNRFART